MSLLQEASPSMDVPAPQPEGSEERLARTPARMQSFETSHDSYARSLAQDRAALVSRRWAASLLLSGAVSGFCSFFFALLFGVFRTFSGAQEAACFLGQRCPSGRSYHADTVSELVSQENSPSRNIFYAFATIACICLVTSRYPWELKNVYTGDTSIGALRAVLPPLGMLTVAMLPVVPKPSRTSLALTMVCSIHTFGAVVFVAGYLLLESWSLYKLWWKLTRPEREVRTACVIAGTVCITIFEIAGGLPNFIDLCCPDQYMATEDAMLPMCGHVGHMNASCQVALDVLTRSYGNHVLIDSAHGAALTLKKIAFWSETGAGVFIVVSHLLIWYFCEERHFRIARLP